MRVITPVPHRKKVRTIILGAGIAGRLILEEIERHPDLGYVPLGFLDDDAGKRKRRIGGFPVLGKLDDLPAVARKQNADLALLAIPSATGSLHQRIIDFAENAGVELRVVPGMYEVLQKDTIAGKIRPMMVEDLVRRPPVPFDLNALRQTLSGKTVLITGAAGSIGNEICRQVAKFSPRLLILFDHEESNLYEAVLSLEESCPQLSVQAELGDIRNRMRVRRVLQRYQPDVIYHAAAYKHVPMMEINPIEGIKTNIFGTQVVVEEAIEQQVPRFVLISTDKAVNPSCVMGACKRFAEMLVTALAKKAKHTACMVVRFGNVMASRGNVLERFSQQIERGGPITITHPKMKRFFMTREEAAQLVMQASALGEGGELFVLDMGRPVAIFDLAKQMIRLAGLRPNEDIDIEYTGMRAGEKLSEELFTSEEEARSTKHQRVHRVDPATKPWRSIAAALKAFQRCVDDEDALLAKNLLRRYVPNYKEPNYEKESSGNRRRTPRQK